MTRNHQTARPSAEQYTDSLIQRLYIEENYGLVADVDEQGLELPDKERWEEAITNEEDEDRLDELLAQLDDAFEAQQDGWHPLGGVRRPEFRDMEGKPYKAPLFTAPTLLPLGQYAKAILAKNTLQATRIMVIFERTLPKTLTQEQLLGVGETLARWQVFGDEAANTKDNAKKHKAIKTSPVLIELVVIGDRVDSPAQRRDLKALTKRFNPRQKVLVSAHMVDTGSQKVWSSTLPWSRRRRKNLYHALQHSHQSEADMMQAVQSSGKNPVLVAVGILSALSAHIGAQALVVFGDLIESGLGFWLPHLLAPLVAILTTLQSARIKHEVDQLARVILLVYLPLYAGTTLYILWPPQLLLVGLMGLAGFLLWSITLATATMMKFD